MIQYTKILDVNDIFYTGDAKDLSNAGYDMYIPKFNSDFLDSLKKLNTDQELNKELFIVKLPNKIDDNFVKYHLMDNKNNMVGIIVKYDNNENNSYIELHKNISIPSGIQFLFPEQYYGELCTRSSNFKKDEEIVLGYIDNSYTFGTGFQVKLINNEKIRVYENEKFVQLILRKYEKPEMKQLSFGEFENTKEVIERRHLRSGGFGSSGRW